MGWRNFPIKQSKFQSYQPDISIKYNKVTLELICHLKNNVPQLVFVFALQLCCKLYFHLDKIIPTKTQVDQARMLSAGIKEAKSKLITVPLNTSICTSLCVISFLFTFFTWYFLSLGFTCILYGCSKTSEPCVRTLHGFLDHFVWGGSWRGLEQSGMARFLHCSCCHHFEPGCYKNITRPWSKIF